MHKGIGGISLYIKNYLNSKINVYKNDAYNQYILSNIIFDTSIQFCCGVMCALGDQMNTLHLVGKIR
jgi:hypothetical protein